MKKPIKTTKLIKKKKSSKTAYVWSVGRRKTAKAKVRLFLNEKGGIVINEKPIEEYFPGEAFKKLYLAPLRSCNAIGKYLITIKVNGSGKLGQLGAVIHGIARALTKVDEKFRPVLRKRGFLTRDPRKKERRKAGTGGKARRQKQSPKR